MSAELIGQVNPDITGAGITSDLCYVTRDLEELDRQARLLEDSGLARILGAVVRALPDAGFSYSDLVGIYPDGTRPGYVLQRDCAVPEAQSESATIIKQMTISSDGKYLRVSSAETSGNSTSYRPNGPIFRSQMDQAKTIELIDHMIEIGFISEKQRLAISVELARS